MTKQTASDPYSRRISLEELLAAFKTSPQNLSAAAKEFFLRMDTAYRETVSRDEDSYRALVEQRLGAGGTLRNAAENRLAFEKGWARHLRLLENSAPSDQLLRPQYFRPSEFLRYQKRIICPRNPQAEYDLFTFARFLLFERYLKLFGNITELGCGSCQNLWMLSKLFGGKRLCGADFVEASVRIADRLGSISGRSIRGVLFDMTRPSADFHIPEGSAIFTIHALEQLGESFEPLMDFLLDSKAGLILHYEPTFEFYEPSNPWDRTAIEYSKQRNYLRGYYPRLRQLAQEGRIELMEAWRPGLGGVLHESSVIAWKPV